MQYIGSAYKRAAAAMYEMSSSVVRGQRRMILYSEQRGVLLAARVIETKLPGSRAKSRMQFFWSDEYSVVPGLPSGACSFLNQSQLDEYIPKRSQVFLPKFTMKAWVVMPADQPHKCYMAPVMAIEDAIGRKYLRMMVEMDILEKNSNRSFEPDDVVF